MDIKHSLRHHAQDFYWGNHQVQQVYSWISMQRGRQAERRGELYEALCHYCNAARRIRSKGLRNRRLLTLVNFVKRHSMSHNSPTLAGNAFIQGFQRSAEAKQMRDFLHGLTPNERVDFRKNIIVLKAPEGHERGVLLLQYTRSFEFFLVNFDLTKIGPKYSIVLEPSWATYPEPYWVLYSCSSVPVVTQLISQEAVSILESTGLHLQGVPIGAQDWIDPEQFKPDCSTKKIFDLVMIANFARFKRHEVLFRAMRKLRPRRLKVAIIGRTWERTREQFDAMMRRYDVQDDCTVFQGLAAREVNAVLNQSKVNVLLSKIEGGNRGLMEGWAANVPCVVYSRIIGPRLEDINAETGLVSGDEELPEVLLKVIDTYDRFNPRGWFLRNTGYKNATLRLNAVLRNEALRRREPWTKDIAAKVNRLELEYADANDREKLSAAWSELKDYLVLL